MYIHPLVSTARELVKIFDELGFSLVDGPEVESVEYNFDKLNIPKNHPARDMQDTFYTKDGRVLRTHTSNVQVRALEKYGAPIKIISIGKTYRNEATDATHEAQFSQIEGMYVDEDVSMGHLKYVLKIFMQKFFKSDVDIRFRASYFPFVEPGVEVDVKLRGDNVPEKLKNKWIEVLGAGVMHPNVLLSAGIDPDKYSGFAFGSGLERLTMLKYGIDDIRLFNSADLRFLTQFKK